MIKFDTVSGLRGRLVRFASTGPREGIALVLREDAPVPSRPYSTHRIYESEGGYASIGGRYDMSLGRAEADFRERTGDHCGHDSCHQRKTCIYR